LRQVAAGCAYARSGRHLPAQRQDDRKPRVTNADTFCPRDDHFRCGNSSNCRDRCSQPKDTRHHSPRHAAFSRVQRPLTFRASSARRIASMASSASLACWRTSLVSACIVSSRSLRASARSSVSASCTKVRSARATATSARLLASLACCSARSARVSAAAVRASAFSTCSRRTDRSAEWAAVMAASARSKAAAPHHPRTVPRTVQGGRPVRFRIVERNGRPVIP
jgi:hypothetical protein